MKPRWIAVGIVALLAVFVAYTVYAKDTVEVKAGDYGTVKGEITVHFTDGTTKTLTKVRTAEYRSASVVQNGTGIAKVSFQCAFKPEKDLGPENVRVCSDAADPGHMSTVYVKAKYGEREADISSYPMSLTVQEDYVTIKTGEYKTLWGSVEVTAAELEQASSLWDIGTNYVIFEVLVWLNIDKDSATVEGFKVRFSVPFTIITLQPLPDPDEEDDSGLLDEDPLDRDDDDDDGGGSSGGSGGGSLSPLDWAVNHNVNFDQTVDTSFSTAGTDTSSTASWRGSRFLR